MTALATKTAFGALAVSMFVGSACSGSDDVANVRGLDTSDDQPDGVTFVAPTNDYTIVFPGEPSLQVESLPVVGDASSVDFYVYEDGASAAYFTSAFDYPDGLLAADSTSVLESARDGALQTTGATLDSSDVIDRNGIPGLEFTFTIDDGSRPGVGAALLFFDDPRMYQSFALGDPDGGPSFEAFIDTFEFTNTSSTEAGS